MNENTGFAIADFPGLFGHPKEDTAARKINDGIQTACLEIVSRIERCKDTSTDKELIDLSMCLSGLVTAWNIASLRAGYGCYPAATGLNSVTGGEE